MACRRYLNEFPDTEIVEEIKKRHELRVAGLCDYCQQKQIDMTCKFPERHRRDLPAGPNLDRARGYKADNSGGKPSEPTEKAAVHGDLAREDQKERDATKQAVVRELAGVTSARSSDARDNCSKCEAKRDEILKEIRAHAKYAFDAMRVTNPLDPGEVEQAQRVLASSYRSIRRDFSEIMLLGTNFSYEIRIANAYRTVVGDLLIGDPS